LNYMKWRTSLKRRLATFVTAEQRCNALLKIAYAFFNQ